MILMKIRYKILRKYSKALQNQLEILYTCKVYPYKQLNSLDLEL